MAESGAVRRAGRIHADLLGEAPARLRAALRGISPARASRWPACPSTIPFVMQAWGQSQHVPDGLMMLADGNADFTRALGLELDASAYGMGTRSRRFALYAEDGVVQASSTSRLRASSACLRPSTCCRSCRSALALATRDALFGLVSTARKHPRRRRWIRRRVADEMIDPVRSLEHPRKKTPPEGGVSIARRLTRLRCRTRLYDTLGHDHARPRLLRSRHRARHPRARPPAGSRPRPGASGSRPGCCGRPARFPPRGCAPACPVGDQQDLVLVAELDRADQRAVALAGLERDHALRAAALARVLRRAACACRSRARWR